MFNSGMPMLNLGANAGSRQTIPAAISDIGCEREINEDRYAVIDSPIGKAWLVCDGMGGVSGGDLAAQLAIDAIRRGLNAREYSTPQEAINTAVEEANRVIVLRRQNQAFANMGTTVVSAMIHGSQVIISSAGDSRAYLVRSGEIEQLTIDHTYVQDLVDRGAIDEQDALDHPQAHVLTRCIGAEPQVKLDSKTYWIWDSTAEAGVEDKLILCTDGLYSLVSEEEISEMVSSTTPQESCVKLVDKANQRGGYDNITIAIIPLGGQLREEDPGPQSRPVVRGQRNVQVRTPFISAPRLSMVQKLMLMGFVTLVGSLLTALLMVLKIAGS